MRARIRRLIPTAVMCCLVAFFPCRQASCDGIVVPPAGS